MDIITVWNTFATYVRARFGKDERGASLVEYALLVALIAVAVSYTHLTLPTNREV